MIKFTVKGTLDTFIVYSFVTIFFYMMNCKFKGEDISTQGKRIVTVVLSFVAIYCFSAFVSWNICWTLLNVSFFGLSPEGRVIVRLIMQPFGYTLDVIIFCGLLFLFHYQGCKQIQASQDTSLSIKLDNH
jgi:hypothetical protein